MVDAQKRRYRRNSDDLPAEINVSEDQIDRLPSGVDGEVGELSLAAHIPPRIKEFTRGNADPIFRVVEDGPNLAAIEEG